MNYRIPLYIGIAILLIFLVVILVPSWFADYNPYGMISLKSWVNEYGTLDFAQPPFEPDDRYVLGSDALGRDVWSLVVHGTKLTLSIGASVALLRLLFGLLSGLIAGFDIPLASGFNRRMNTVFNAIPPLIIAIILLKLRFFASLPRAQSIQAFVGVLAFVGWARLGELIEDRTREILSRTYIASELAIGKSRIRIAFTNVLPHLIPELAVLLFFEIARVLTMMLQLGIFQVFVGNIQIIQSTDFGVITTRPIGYEPEWASMLAVTRTYLRTAPWIIVPPALAFTLSILGFNMVGEGLRNRFQYRFDVGSGRKRWWKRVVPVMTFVGLIVVMALTGTGEAVSFEQLSDGWLETDHVTCGINAESVAETLAAELESLGLEPVRDHYIHSYNVESRLRPVTASLEVDHQALTYGEDFIILGTHSQSFGGEVRVDERLEVLGQVLPDAAAGEMLKLQSQFYQFEAMMRYAEALTRETAAGGIIIEIPEDEPLSVPELDSTLEGVIVLVKEGLIPEGSIIEGSVTVEQAAGKGYNVIGMIEGKEDKVNDEAVVIGIHYNVLNAQVDQRLELMRDWIRLLLSFETEMDQRIVLVFYDGFEGMGSDGKAAYLNRPLYPANDTAVYLDLDMRDLGQTVDVRMSNRGIAIGDYFGWSFRYALIQEALDLGFSLETSHVQDVPIHGFIDKGIPSIHLTLDGRGEVIRQFEWISTVILKNDF